MKSVRMSWVRWAAVLTASAFLMGSASQAWAEEWRDGWPVVTQMKPGESDAANFQVQIAQYLLRAHGFAVKVDPNFGVQSVAAVRRFQRSRGLKATGVLSAPTWRKLIVTVRQGSRGDAVRAVQLVLHDSPPPQGDSRLPVDGIFGVQTRRALEKWQRDVNLKPDGIVGPATWRKLLFNVAD